MLLTTALSLSRRAHFRIDGHFSWQAQGARETSCFLVLQSRLFVTGARDRSCLTSRCNFRGRWSTLDMVVIVEDGNFPLGVGILICVCSELVEDVRSSDWAHWARCPCVVMVFSLATHSCLQLPDLLCLVVGPAPSLASPISCNTQPDDQKEPEGTAFVLSLRHKCSCWKLPPRNRS